MFFHIASPFFQVFQKPQVLKTFTALPFAQAQTLDLNHYVANKAMDGLFVMIAEEEKKIRTDPAARVTDLLQKVFTK